MQNPTTSSIDAKIMLLKNRLVERDMEAHTCEYCQHISLQRLTEGDEDAKESREPSYLFDTTVADTRDLAAKNCDFWAIISNKIALIDLEGELEHSEQHSGSQISSGEDTTEHSSREDENAETIMDDRESELQHILESENQYLYWDRMSPANDQVHLVTQEDFVRVILRYNSRNDFKVQATIVDLVLILPMRPVNHPTLRNHVDEGRGFLLQEHSAHFWVLSTPDNLTSRTKRFIGTPINLRPQSKDSMELYRDWLRKCQTDHLCGIGNLPASMPSLILDVSSLNLVRLLEVPESKMERYLALSYCWGTSTQSIMLTKSTKDDLLSGISTWQLDPTIRDAVTTTRELGFRLLWVDALCVIQDDQDWKTSELAIMGQIYRNATFTLVPSASRNVKEGFLHSRTFTLNKSYHHKEYPRPWPVFRFKCAKSGDEEQTGSVILIPNDIDEPDPWYERGWTLQELLFSKRRLQFRESQTTWVCYGAEVSAQECDGWLSGADYRVNGYSDEDFEPVMPIVQHSGITRLAEEVHSHWYDLIKMYTRRKLTYVHDQLPAISSIAKEFASVLGTAYCCGLWESDLVNGLFWTPSDGDDANHTLRKRPSWSWTSYDGPVDWWNYNSDPWREPWRQNEHLEFPNGIMGVMSLDHPYSIIRDPELKVRGLLYRVPQPSNEEEPELVKDYVEPPPLHIRFDYPNEPNVQAGSDRITRLLVLSTLEWDAVRGLVVLEEGDSRYTRVGAFWSYRSFNRWPDMRGGMETEMPDRAADREEYQAQLRRIFGDEPSIEDIILI